MRMIGSLLALLGGALLAAPEPAHASTLTHYYVSQPYEISNYRGPAKERPLMTTGSVVLDTAKLPGSGKLAGQRVVDFFDWEHYENTSEFRQVRTPALVSYEFSNARNMLFGALDMTFDVNGRVDRWEVFDGNHPGGFAEIYGNEGDRTRGGGFDGVYGMFGDEDFMYLPEQKDKFLRQLGYEPHMQQYQEYVDDHAMWYWRAHASGAGMWFDNLADFAAQVESNTRWGVANPPRSIYDIAPVPVPMPFALLVGGFGALLLLRRRGQAGRPQRS